MRTARNPTVYKSRLQFAIKQANRWISEYDSEFTVLPDSDDPNMGDVFVMAIGYPCKVIGSYFESFKRLRLVDPSPQDR